MVKVGLLAESQHQEKLERAWRQLDQGELSWVCHSLEELARLAKSSLPQVELVLCRRQGGAVKELLAELWETDITVLEGTPEQIMVGLCRHLFSRLEQIGREERLAGIGHMAERVAHDLKNPLTTVMGFGQVLGYDNISPEERQEALSMIRQGTQRMMGILDEINMFVQEVIPRPKLERVKLEQFLAQVVEPLKSGLESRGIKYEITGPKSVQLECDLNRLSLALANLITNAAEAMTGGGRLEISWEYSQGRVSLMISDSGPGIDRSIRDRVFDPLVTYGKSGRLGLGLSLAKKIVEEHGGTIRLEKTGKSGTVFALGLPGFK
jgi:signal transduction histidine kinase